jgi:hypothetical protein
MAPFAQTIILKRSLILMQETLEKTKLRLISLTFKTGVQTWLSEKFVIKITLQAITKE